MPDLRAIGELDHLLNECLTGIVGGVRLPCDDQLDRPVRVEQQCLQTLRIAQHQRQTLVGRYPPGESDCQHVGIERRWDPAQFGFGGTALQPRLGQPFPHIGDQLGAQLRSDPPDMSEVHLVDSLPLGGFAQHLGGAGQFPGQLHPFRRRPRGSVHTVGDRPDRHLRWVEPGPQLIEHGPAYPAVQLGHPVGPLGQSQTHVCHVEFVRIVLRTESQHPFHRHARQQSTLGIVAEVALHHLQRESIDTRRNRCVRGEHRAGPHHGQRGIEVEMIGGHELADALQSEETRVALVHMEDVRGGPGFDGCECADGPDTADTGEKFLFDAVLLVTAVQPVGHIAQIVVVLRDVRIEKQQRDSADLGHPDAGPQHP